jgi:hypothetical protein
MLGRAKTPSIHVHRPRHAGYSLATLQLGSRCRPVPVDRQCYCIPLFLVCWRSALDNALYGGCLYMRSVAHPSDASPRPRRSFAWIEGANETRSCIAGRAGPRQPPGDWWNAETECVSGQPRRAGRRKHTPFLTFLILLGNVEVEGTVRSKAW